ncbi:MAG: hypothetical protein WEF50_06690 [Myxococcota bacterium]
MAMPEIASDSKRALVARRFLVLAGAIALGLVLQDLLRARLDAIAALSERDMLAARAELALVFRVVSTLVFGVTGALGAAIAGSSRRMRDVRGRLGVGVGIALVVLSAAAFALVWYMAAVLAACRA